MHKKDEVDPEEVLEALRLWHSGSTDSWPLASLEALAATIEDEEAYGTLADAGPAACNRAMLHRGLEALASLSPAASDLLRQRFEHGLDVVTVANRLNLAESTVLYRQRQAIKLLADALNDLNHQAVDRHRQRLLDRLEVPTYAQLVGVDGPRQSLLDALRADGGPFVVVIEGLGGLGKTALADAVTRALILAARFDEVAWVTAKQTHLSAMGRLQVESGRPALTVSMLLNELGPQLAGRLPQPASLQPATELLQQQALVEFLRLHRCLVVIDNLETVADYASLLPQLHQWRNPTKFLLTSRRRLMDQADVYAISLQELKPHDAFQLIRLEAARTGFLELQQADGATLQRLYDMVGGNPLALKLLVGQLRFYSLERVLSRFDQSGVQSQEGLFEYIYREAWEGLSDHSQDCLMALLEAGESGFSFAHLQVVTGLTERNLRQSLEELVLVSLVDLGGSLVDRRYKLHRLTELFLRRLLD